MFGLPLEQLMEMLRKFLLIGLLVTIEPGTIMQISFGTIICASYLVRMSAPRCLWSTVLWRETLFAADICDVPCPLRTRTRR